MRQLLCDLLSHLPMVHNCHCLRVHCRQSAVGTHHPLCNALEGSKLLMYPSAPFGPSGARGICQSLASRSVSDLWLGGQPKYQL